VCGTDYHIFEGKHPFLCYPRVIGHELSVEILEAPAGSDLSAGEICVVNPYLSCGRCIACRKGKPNCCAEISVLGVHQDGGMTGVIAVPVSNLIPAEGLSLDEGATVEFLSIGAHAVRRGCVAGRDRVLVVGAGPIGLGAALFARLTGAETVILDKDTERTAAARDLLELGTIVPDGDPAEAVSTYTGGDGFDVVLDATGNQQAMEKGFELVAHGGRYVLVSVIKDSVTFADPDFHKKEMTLCGSRNATSEDFAQVIAAIRGGDLPASRLITHRTSLTGAMEHIPLWATEKSGLIKAVIEVGS
jgi:2-desacetyl-2-hydroxyethyl bacteriochlorophyllide A dehydrogenase